MRDVTVLHPTLQSKIAKLQTLCKKNGIVIGISECLRTTAEQDALYAQGRTKSGSIVTNAKGSTYSSMHQWGVAADFYLLMDVDGDGKTADDAFNNATGLFNRIGELGQSIGLEWGGSWKSLVDLPHFQLPDWGSTATRLKSLYGTPEKFMATWSNAASVTETKAAITASTTASKSALVVDAAESKDVKIAGTYGTTANLNLRAGAGSAKGIILTVPKGSSVINYGYYTASKSKKWYFVQYGKYTGFVESDYLKKK